MLTSGVQGVRKRSREPIKQQYHLTVLECILSVTFQVTNGSEGAVIIPFQWVVVTQQPLALSHPFVPDRLPPLFHYIVCILHACSVVTCDDIPTIGAGDQTPANLGLFLTPKRARTSPDPLNSLTAPGCARLPEL